MTKPTEKGVVLSLGSINADFQIRVERRPELSETLLGRDFARFGGGKAANVAYLAQRLRINAQLFGCVGEDDLAEQALSLVREAGVDLSGVRRRANTGTGVAMISVPPDGKKGILLAANANNAWTAADSEAVMSAIGEAQAGSVLVVDCEVPVEIVECAAAAAKSRRIPVILDPSPAEKVTAQLIASADFILPNASEAQQLTGIKPEGVDSAVRASRRLLDKGAGAVCAKLSDGGCVLVEKDRVSQISSFPVEVTDTTGAGDAFAGGFAVALIEGQRAVEAARFAVACSHFLVGHYGSQISDLTRAKIDDIAQRLQVTPCESAEE